MPKPFLPADAARVLFRLTRGELHKPQVAATELPPLERFLRAWQSDRLIRTHADFLENPEFGAAAKFFLSDVYADRDFSRRDAELEALYKFLQPLLPQEALESMTNSVALNRLTYQLDGEMVERLEAMGVTEVFTPKQYEAAYRQGRYEDRVAQIDLVVTLMRQVADLHHFPFIGTALLATRAPAKRMGWQELHDFLERGYDAWRGVRDPEPFLHAIMTREHALNDRLFGRG